VAIRVVGQAVDHLVERSVAAAGDNQLAMVANRLLGDFRGVAGAGGFGEFGFDTAGSEDLASLVDKAATPIATVAGVGVVDQQSILDRSVHDFRMTVNDSLYPKKTKPKPKSDSAGRIVKRREKAAHRWVISYFSRERARSNRDELESRDQAGSP
jgi:hypothetical protein